jgi:hypothetical protein
MSSGATDHSSTAVLLVLLEYANTMCMADLTGRGDQTPLPVRIHTVYVWRILQGGVSIFTSPSL